MIDTLLRALDLRTGRFTSPHVERMTERISDRRRAAHRRGVRARVQRRRAVHPPRRRRPGPPAVVLRDRGRRWRTPRSPTPRSTSPWSRSAWAARGTRPTSPTPRSRWCCRSRSTTRSTSATRPPTSRVEKAGIIKPGSIAVLAAAGARGRRGAAASAPPRSARPSSARAWSSASSRGCRRSAARCVSLQGLRARYDDVFLPLYGAHQAQNAAVALAAVEAFAGGEPAARRGAGPRGVRRGDLARPPRDRPAQPDGRARRRPQPARRRGARRPRSRTRSRSPR